MNIASISVIRRLSSIGLGILCSLSFLPSGLHAESNLADVIERVELSVVRIEAKGADGESIGSGFVVEHGLIATNFHVLAGAQEATVHFSRGQKGRIEGTLLLDESRDVAIARISFTEAPSVRLASQMPRKGDTVIALGSPHGLSFTATTGIVSAIRSEEEMARDLHRDGVQGTWLQVDAALSPGNSGGPIINDQGEVMGMSTLASQGSAQNLNFGISAADIRTAIAQAMNASLTPLRTGAGLMSSAASNNPAQNGLGDMRPIPPQAIREYVGLGQSEFTELVRGLRLESARLSGDLQEMRRGASFMPREVNREAVVARVEIPGQRRSNWFFRSDEIKEAIIEHQQKRIRECNQLKYSVRSANDVNSMTALLWNFGPVFNPRKEFSVGFAFEVIVLRAMNEHDVLAVIDNQTYLLWLPSTIEISPGNILSLPVYVAGATRAEFESGSTAAVTVLQAVPKDELQEVIRKELTAAEIKEVTPHNPSGEQSGYREWNDRSGQFSIEAVLLSNDGKTAKLKKRDGDVIDVPHAALSDADLRYIAQGAGD